MSNILPFRLCAIIMLLTRFRCIRFLGLSKFSQVDMFLSRYRTVCYVVLVISCPAVPKWRTITTSTIFYDTIILETFLLRVSAIPKNSFP